MSPPAGRLHRPETDKDEHGLSGLSGLPEGAEVPACSPVLHVEVGMGMKMEGIFIEQTGLKRGEVGVASRRAARPIYR